MVVKHDEGGRYCSNSEPTTSSTIQFIFYAFQYTMKLPSLASIRKKMRCKSFFSGNFILLHSFHLLKLSVNRLWMGLCSLTIAKPRRTYRSRHPYPMPRLSLIKFELYESFDERVDKKEKIYSLPRNNIVIIISLVSNRVRYM